VDGGATEVVEVQIGDLRRRHHLVPALGKIPLLESPPRLEDSDKLRVDGDVDRCAGLVLLEDDAIGPDMLAPEPNYITSTLAGEKQDSEREVRLGSYGVSDEAGPLQITDSQVI
jgi:hypothetical protein